MVLSAIPYSKSDSTEKRLFSMNKKFTAWLLAWGLIFTGVGTAQSSVAAEPTTSVANDTTGVVNPPDTVATGPGIDVPTPEPSPSATATAEPSAEPSATPSATPGIVDPPQTPSISLVKGGNKRIKIYWGKISNATGYKIYYSTSQTGTYSLVKTIKSNATVKYVKTGLTQNKTYYFKMTAYTSENNIVAESVFSNVVSAKTGAIGSTSKTAKSYSSKAKFKKSPAYKKYAALSKYCTYSKSFPIPGMKTTNVGGFAAKKMIPQGICQAGGYYLISAYDYYEQDETVIYIMNLSTHSYITTLVLPNKAQANALAYDGTNVWVSKGSNVAYFPYSVITSAVNSGSSFTTLSDYTGYMKLDVKPQVLAYNDGILWAAANNSSSSSNMYGYKITKSNGMCTLNQKYRMAIPSKVQGITFDKEGYMYMTRSYRSNSSLSGYVSQIRTYKPNLASPSAKGGVGKGSIVKKRTLPAMAEGVATYGSYVYVLYSGCKYTKCKYKVDRVIATKRSHLQQ